MGLDLTDIRKRTENATAGPWVDDHNPESDDGDHVWVETHARVAGVSRSGHTFSRGSWVCGMTTVNPYRNAAFIAHSREDIPDLCDEVENLRAERDAMLRVVRAAVEWDGVDKATSIITYCKHEDALVRAIDALPAELRARVMEGGE